MDGDDMARGEAALPWDDILADPPEADPRGADRGPGRATGWIALTAVLAAGWTALFAWAHAGEMAGAPPARWVGWIADWAVPIALLGLVWLIAMRNSRREAARFAGAARSLSLESERLEARLLTVNRELSLARDFLTAQGRELESFGRIASDNLSRHADQLQGLVQDNGREIDRLGEVSTTARANLEKLRADLPVAVSSARDVANGIGQAGSAAEERIERLQSGFDRLTGSGAESERRICALEDRIDAALGSFEAQTAMLERRLTAHLDDLRATTEEQAERIARTGEEAHAQLMARDATFEEEFDQRRARIDEAQRTATDAMDAEMQQLGAKVSNLAERLLGSTEAMRHQADETTRRIEMAAERFSALRGETGDARHDIEAATGALAGTVERAHELLGQEREQIGTLTDASVRLLELVQACARHSGDVLPQAINEVESQLRALDTLTDALEDRLSDNAARARATRTDIEASQEAGERVEDGLGALHMRLQTLREEFQNEVDAWRETFERLGDDTADEFARKVTGRSQDGISALKAAAESASGAAREAAHALAEQIAEVESKAQELEQRVADARTRAEEHVDGDFARRAALVTESLNSNAIDIAQALSTDVSDTAWSRYLRGDRGIFTRRAVGLLDSTTAREIAELYDSDSEFRAQVSRYIHDFEAMLRTMLAVRDGNVIGVTLLGSDMGKLYVALAQAIERLREE